MLSFYQTENGGILPIDRYAEGCWVNAVNPTPEEITFLQQTVHLDAGFISAALDEEESSRVEVEEDQTLVMIDTPYSTTEGEGTLVYTTIPLGIIITKTNIVTICLWETTVVREILQGTVKNLQTTMKTRFLLSILLRVAQNFLASLNHINRLSTQIQNRLRKSMKNKELLQMMGLQKSLVYFSTSLKADEITLEKILRGRVIRLYEEDQDLLEDVLIEYKQAVEMSQIYSDILNGTMDTFASVISNNLNDVMKTLTIVTLLMSIPTMIFSFYGMNMLDLNSYLPYTWFALAISLLLVAVVGVLFWKKK